MARWLDLFNIGAQPTVFQGGELRLLNRNEKLLGQSKDVLDSLKLAIELVLQSSQFVCQRARKRAGAGESR